MDEQMWYNDRTAEQLGLLDSSSHGFCWNCSGKSIEEWECNSFFVNCLNTSVMTIQLIQLSRFGLEVGNPCDAKLKRKHTCHHVADCLKYVPSVLYATHVVLFRFVSGSQKGHLYVAVLPDVYLRMKMTISPFWCYCHDWRNINQFLYLVHIQN